MGGEGSGRPPSVETIIRRQQPVHTPIGNDIHIPNLSGDHSAGTVKDTPVENKDIVNKEYVDAAVLDVKLNEVANPDASKTFNLGNEKFLTFSSVDRTPVAGEGIFNWETSGNFTGDLCHIHQHTGNAGAGTVLLHLEGEDTDITPFRISDGTPTTIFNVDLSGNLTLAGTVGVGITTPQEKHHVHNTVADSSSGSLYTNATTGSASSDGLYIGYQDIAYIWNYENTGMQIATNNQPRIIIEAGGNVGIGLAPTSKLDVGGDIKVSGTVDGIDIATDVAANTLKETDVNHNVTTNLSAGTRAPTTIDVNSSDGTNATLVEADTTNAGILGSDKWDEIVANTLKETDVDHNVTTNLSLGAGNATTEVIACSDGTDCTLIEADTDNAGLLGADKWDEIVANTAAKHTQGTDTALGSGAVAADHGTAATDQIVNVCYGTGDPPAANTTTIGSLFVKYTA